MNTGSDRKWMLNRSLKTVIILLVFWIGAAGSICAEDSKSEDWQGTYLESEADVPEHRRYGKWRASRMNGGGYIQEVIPCPSDPKRFYAWVDVGGPFRSDDGGRTWRSITANLPPKEGAQDGYALLVDPENADRLLYACGLSWRHWRKPWAGCFLSEDGGKSWKQTLEFEEPCANRQNGGNLVRNPKDPNEILLATGLGGIYRSRDGGVTWENIGLQGTMPQFVKYDLRNPKNIWVSSRSNKARKIKKEEGLFFSSNSGETWEKISDRVPIDMVQLPYEPDRLYAVSKQRAIIVSNDNGKTWVNWIEGLPYKEKGPAWNTRNLHYMALTHGPDFLLTASKAGTFYSLPKGGTSWEKRSDGKGEVGNWWGRGAPGKPKQGRMFLGLTNLVVDPANPDRWFYTGAYDLGRTDDGGKNFVLSMEGMEATVIHSIQVDLKNPKIVHMGMADNGYLRSENGGLSFDRPHGGAPDNLKLLVVSPDNPDRLYGNGPERNHWALTHVHISEDNGKTWNKSSMTGMPKISKMGMPTLAVNPNNAMELYAGISGKVKENGPGLYRSTDGGMSWNWFSQGFTPGEACFGGGIWFDDSAIAVSSDGSMICAGRLSSSVYA
ncbi:MAG: hypothetical protein AAF558_12395 [Verrucomicrobiota bacterium]